MTMFETVPLPQRSVVTVEEPAHLPGPPKHQSHGSQSTDSISNSLPLDAEEQERLVAHAKEAATALARDLRAHMRRSQARLPKKKRRVYGYWLSAEDECHIAEEKYGEGSWPCKIVRFIQSKQVQTLLIVLLVIDVLVVMVELFLDAEYPACSKVVRDAISCAADDTSSSGSMSTSTSSSGSTSTSTSGSSGTYCADGTIETGVVSAATRALVFP